MGLFKRGGVWWMRFSHKGKQVRRSTETADRRLAEKIYAKAQTLAIEGKWFERQVGEEKTLNELLDKYIEEYSVSNKAEKTAEQDRCMQRSILDFFGDIRLTEVSPSRVSSYKSHLKTKGYKASTINKHRGLLAHAFKKAQREWEWVKDNPLDKVSREKVRDARDRWLTQEEEKTLLDSCVIYATGKENVLIPRYWLKEIVLFDLNTGMRMDEILSLEWPHVDLFRKTATVMKSKNGEKRTIPLNQTAFELLKEKSKVRHIKCRHVFASEAGSKIDARNLRRAFYNALEKAEITDFRFHDLRHTFATNLAQAGVDLYKISKVLGHKSLDMVTRYAHHCTESLRDGVEVLDKKSTNIAQPNEKGATAMP